MKYRITTWLAAALMLSSLHATAASLSDIQVSNGDQQARITLSFVGEPEYSFTPQGKRLVALDIKQTGVLQGLPLKFSGSNLVKSIRAGTPQDSQTLRLLVDLTEDGKKCRMVFSGDIGSNGRKLLRNPTTPPSLRRAYRSRARDAARAAPRAYRPDQPARTQAPRVTAAAIRALTIWESLAIR